MSADEQRKLAAIMFTDMAGYSALAQHNDRLALELLEEHRQLLREIFPRFNGAEIKTIGDAFLVEFHSALEAAQCAIEIQRKLAKRNCDVPNDRRIDLKIGIHIGDVLHRGGDVYGDGVNIASRIEPLAGAGGICVSMDVERQVRNALEARFEKLAQTELKNISVPMDLFRIVLPWERKSEVRDRKSEIRKSFAISKRKNPFLIGALGLLVVLAIALVWWWTTRSHQSPAATTAAVSRFQNIPAKSIAVLPFENLSDDKSNAYFAEGIQDEILTRLAKIGALKVISRTSTARFASSPQNLPEIARQLAVANILEGSVQKANDQVRVNVQLIDAATSAHLWAETYDRKLTDIFAVESDIARTVADTLQAKLTDPEKRAIAAQPTSDTTAYELYLKGRSLWAKRSGDNIPRAISLYKQVIARDPNYALAYSGLAEAYAVLVFYSGVEPAEAFAQGKAAALKALQLNDNLAEAHAALAFLLCIADFDMAGSVREFQRAIALNPNYATAHQWYGVQPLTALGRFDEAVAEEKRAIELDPLSSPANADLGWTLMEAGRYNDAIIQLQKTLEIDPTFYPAHYNLGVALQLKGDLPGAIAEYRKGQELSDDVELPVMLATAEAQSGDEGAAAKMLSDLEKLSKNHYSGGAYWRALLHLSLGNRDEAIHWLEQSVADRAGSDIAFIKVFHFLDPLRNDSRFEALVQKVVGEKK